MCNHPSQTDTWIIGKIRTMGTMGEFGKIWNIRKKQNICEIESIGKIRNRGKIDK